MGRAVVLLFRFLLQEGFQPGRLAAALPEIDATVTLKLGSHLE